MKFFGFSLDLCFDKVTEYFGISGGFDINGHCCILGSSSVQDDFQLFGHGAFAGKCFDGSELAGPTFDKKFLKEHGVGSKERVEDYLLDGRGFG